MKPVYFFGTRAKELAKRLHPVTNTRCLDLWTDGAEHYYLRTMRACGNRWRLHSFLLLPDWRIKAKNNHAQKPPISLDHEQRKNIWQIGQQAICAQLFDAC